MGALQCGDAHKYYQKVLDEANVAVAEREQTTCNTATKLFMHRPLL